MPLAEAVGEALVAWAEFANTGDIAAIESGFVVGGRQHQQLDEVEFPPLAGHDCYAAMVLVV